MRLSVIIPVHGGVEMLEASLLAIRRSLQQPAEVIVVDDGSPAELAEQIGKVATAAGAQLIRQVQSGPAAARNRGAEEAIGEIVVFIDADVNVHAESLGQLAEAFASDAGLSAVFGSYDDQPLAKTLVSDYRNLLHHYAHQNSRRDAKTFWAGCGAIRRAVFLEAGGFDVTFERPSIEDVELGFRMTANGHRIELRREIQCTHAKRWTLRSFFLTDLKQRAIPWTEMLFAQAVKLPADLNFGLSQKLSVPLALLLLVSLLFALRSPLLGGAAAAACALSLGLLNWQFFGFLARLRGALFALGAFPCHVVHYWAGGFGYIGGCLRVWRRIDPQLPIAAATLTVIILGWQVASGTYQSDFAGHPDAPSHYVTGVMTAEYLKHPTLRPMHFAEQYYLHYPKVGIGHWPPLFYILEGFWFICFGVSKTAAMALQALLAFVLVFSVYALARRYVTFGVALGAALLLIMTAPFRQSLEWVMAENCTAVLVIGATIAFARYLEQPGLLMGQAFGLLSALALLTKGSACPLAALPLISLVLNRRFGLMLRMDFWLSALPVLVIAAPWYWFARGFSSPNLVSVGTGRGTWTPGLEYGFPLLLLAALGFFLMPKRDPYVAALAGLVLAFAAAPLSVGAFREGRHLLPAMAAAAVLAVGVWSKFRQPYLAVAISLALSWWLSPASHKNAPEQYRSWAKTMQGTGPILVSGSGLEEGAMVAAMAEVEPMPKRVIFRASRVLSSSGWNLEQYRLLVRDENETRAQIDELGIAFVLQSDGAAQPHDELLRAVTKAWKRIALPGFVLAANPQPMEGRRQRIEQKRLGRQILLDP